MAMEVMKVSSLKPAGLTRIFWLLEITEHSHQTLIETAKPVGETLHITDSTKFKTSLECSSDADGGMFSLCGRIFDKLLSRLLATVR